MGLQRIVEALTFPSPPCSYSLTQYPELLFIKKPSAPTATGIPCLLFAIPRGAPVLVVHAHSNGCDIGDTYRTMQTISESLRVHVMSFEYPGYGLLPGTASMISIDETAGAVLSFILNELHVNPRQLVWYGRSIGSGPAVRTAHNITKNLNQQPGGLIVQCGFANFKEVAGHLFGSMAKRLVNPMWPNETMMADLKCPVLLIHGRADTMIPVEHSQRLWKAVVNKKLSVFHECDCSHNDFNFQQCTLKPIYNFLLGIISAPDFPTTNFSIEVPSSCRAYVRDIGPLRSRIPIYSFQRPDLDEWIRRLQAEKDGTATKAIEGGSDEKEKEDTKTVPTEKGSDSTTEEPAKEPAATPAATPAKGKSKKKGKEKKVEQPPLPDFCAMPPIEDVDEALLDPLNMLRLCAQRVNAFLEHLQRRLNNVESLSEKLVEEVVDMVEAEWWSCDPLLSLWEEVDLPSGSRVRIRLGPFSIDNSGKKGYDPSIAGASEDATGAAQRLRVPLCVFCPSSAHFRCITDWVLLNSERLERELPAGMSSQPGGCCGGCAPFGSLLRRKKVKGRQVRPTRETFCTFLAAHFVVWAEKTDVKGAFRRFTELSRNPSECLGRARRNSELSAIALGVADPSPEPSNGSAPRPLPWTPSDFSDAARRFLKDGSSGNPGPSLLELYASLWSPHDVVDSHQDSLLCDLGAATEMLANPGALILPRRDADWVVSSVLFHFQCKQVERGANDDPCASELRSICLAVSKGMRVFVQADHRVRPERRRPAASGQYEEDSVHQPLAEGGGPSTGPSSQPPAKPAEDDADEPPVGGGPGPSSLPAGKERYLNWLSKGSMAYI